MSAIMGPGFTGVFQAINEEKPAEGDVADDVEGEQETIPNIELGDYAASTNAKGEGTSANGEQMSHLQNSLRDASKGVSEGTDSEYKRLCINIPSHWCNTHHRRADL